MYHMVKRLRAINTKIRIKIQVTFLDDISWWLTFAETFDGYADCFDPVSNDFYQAKLLPCDDTHIHCYDVAAHSYEVYSPKDHAANVNVLELIANNLALSHWSHSLVNCRGLCHCDNLQVCYNLCKDKTKNESSNYCMSL